jgi:hypothetical protein
MQRNLKLAHGFLCFLFLAVFSIGARAASEELVTTAKMKSGEPVPYILNSANAAPHYVMILFPGSTGIMDPRMEDGKLVYSEQTNFLIRSRPLIVDDEFATVATNSTSSEERIQAVIDDIKSRFPTAKIYLMGTSRGTGDTMALAGYLSDKIAGEIHTSSLQSIAFFDAKKYTNRQLVVHHRNDGCKATPFGSAQSSHSRYGNEFIAMEGGSSVGNPCEPFSYHGYNGIEKETIDAIKQWVKQGG